MEHRALKEILPVVDKCSLFYRFLLLFILKDVEVLRILSFEAFFFKFFYFFIINKTLKDYQKHCPTTVQ